MKNPKNRSKRRKEVADLGSVRHRQDQQPPYVVCYDSEIIICYVPGRAHALHAPVEEERVRSCFVYPQVLCVSALVCSAVKLPVRTDQSRFKPCWATRAKHVVPPDAVEPLPLHDAFYVRLLNAKTEVTHWFRHDPEPIFYFRSHIFHALWNGRVDIFREGHIAPRHREVSKNVEQQKNCEDNEADLHELSHYDYCGLNQRLSQSNHPAGCHSRPTTNN